MPGAFLWDDKIVAASITAPDGGTVETMPLSNLVDPQPRLRARLLGGTAALLVDLGADTAIDALALISTTLTESATVRWRMGPAEALVEAAPLFDLRWDSGAIVPPTGYVFSRASTAGCVDASGTMVLLPADTPRYDYDPVSRACLGLLLEEQRSNIVRYSADYTQAAWAKGNVSLTTAARLAPTGVIEMAALVENTTTNAYHQINQGNGKAGTSQIHTASVYVAGLGREVALQISNAVGNAGASIRINPATGAITGTPGIWGAYTGATGGVTHVGGGIYRMWITATTDADTTIKTQLVLYNTAAASSVYTGDGASGVYLWGWQVEQAPTPSSYIPTTSASATRAVDRQYLAGQAIDATAGLAFQVEFSGQTGGTQTMVPVCFTPASTTFTDSWYLAQDAATGRVGLTLLDSVHGDYAYGLGFVAGFGTGVRAAGSAGAAGVVLAVNGAGMLSKTAPPTAAGVFSLVGLGTASWGGTPGRASGVGHLRRIVVYGRQLTEGQVTAAATTGSTLDTTTLVHDSGTIAAETGDEAGGNVVLLALATVSARYLRVDVTADGATTIDIGRLVAGPLWRPSRAFAYGVTEGREMLDRRDRNPLTGASFPVPALANPRVTRFTLPLLTGTEVRGQHRAMVRARGAVGDALWIPETTLGQAERNARSIWGAVAAPGDEAVISRDSFPGSSRSFRIIERV